MDNFIGKPYWQSRHFERILAQQSLSFCTALGYGAAAQAT
jgi:hypothetical protein